MLQLRSLPLSAGEFLNDALARFGIKIVPRLAEAAERNAFDSQSFLDVLQARSGLQPLETRDGGIEEVDEQKSDIVIAKDLTMARRVACGPDSLQRQQEILNEFKVLEPFQFRFIQSRSPSRHAPVTAMSIKLHVTADG